MTAAEEAMIVAFRRHTLLPLDDCLYALQPTIPHLTRSALHLCLQRPGFSLLPDVFLAKPLLHRFNLFPLVFFHMSFSFLHTPFVILFLFFSFFLFLFFFFFFFFFFFLFFFFFFFFFF